MCQPYPEYSRFDQCIIIRGKTCSFLLFVNWGPSTANRTQAKQVEIPSVLGTKAFLNHLKSCDYTHHQFSLDKDQLDAGKLTKSRLDLSKWESKLQELYDFQTTAFTGQKDPCLQKQVS